jgi:hypothetical protein
LQIPITGLPTDGFQLNVLNFISLNLFFGKPAIVVVLASDQASISWHLLTGVGDNDHDSKFVLDDILSFQIQPLSMRPDPKEVNTAITN